MTTDATRPQNGDSTPTNSSRFQQLLSEKLKSLACSPSPSGSANMNKRTGTICDSEPEEIPEPQSQAFLSPASYNFTFSTTPSQASSARRRAGPSLLPAASPPRINPFENGYVGSAKRGPEANGGGGPAPESEPAAKRAKKSRTVALGPDCTCAISTTCARAAASGVRDCRLASITIPKRTKPAGNSNNNKPGLITTTQYISKKKQMEVRRSNDEILDILNQFRKCQTAPKNDLPRIFQLMRDRIHMLHLYEIPPSSISIIKARLLDPHTGLPAIVRSDLVPWDIRLDTDMHLMRLKVDDIDPDIHRGLIVGRAIQESGAAKSLTRSLDTRYRFKKSAYFVGEGHLRIGQWFPYRICAIRDGAHGELEGGIAGRETLGAVSVILSSAGSTTYPDIDQGDTILYCGTRGKNGKVSPSTSLMLESSAKKNEIRVLRSSNLPKVNPYRPAEGIRYDGLYKITEHELLDEEALLYRFTLKRVDGQHPIRYQGAAVRPTEREIKELRNLKEHVSRKKPAKKT